MRYHVTFYSVEMCMPDVFNDLGIIEATSKKEAIKKAFEMMFPDKDEYAWNYYRGCYSAKRIK